LTDYSLWSTLSPVRENEDLDAAVRIRITQGLEEVPLPPLDLLNLTARGFWRQEGTISVVGQWLVARVGDNPGPVETLRRPVVMAFRQVRGFLKFIDFHITKEHKAELAEFLSPHQLLKLTPGRLPVGLRNNHTGTYEVWIPLGDTHENV